MDSDNRKIETNNKIFNISNANIDKFLDSIWTERGLSPNTLTAYRMDLRLLAQ